ncbi:hypothetical protein A2W14_05300 [Candidatus Gottesmanbacteria bacterium RBG_16_37_8]|uniref:Uncharacterized protein n=1 Tax=Candidatus Gottesmanbacteria bacterium RBG_16_37_8 TaxID=1798371 RepID=A0A1F5YTK0_9BACT|nr:MAG: hypothetical protein A2W14_05300 [Candidatus Gottesmanbacteria bacterium RBG_16_37_8]
MTSNQRFYGNINTNIMRTFVNNTRDGKTDLLVIGLVGQGYMKAASFGRHYENFNFSKDIPTVDEAKAFIEKTSTYDQIFVYYPKFISLVNQNVGITDITQAKSEEDKDSEEIKILFEPELLKILEFFNKQVRSLLFIRMMLETDLSLTAARLLAMSAAEERSDDLIKEKKVELRRTMASFVNAQLLETFSSIREWDKREE